MPSSYTPLGFELQAAGENLNTWGSVHLNATLSRINYAIAGYQVVAITGDYILTSSNSSTSQSDFQARNALLKFTGTLAAVATVTVPSTPMQWVFYNATNKALTFTTGSGGTVTVDPGDKLAAYCDGANVSTTTFGGLALKDYIAAAVLGATGSLPAAVGNAGKVLQSNGTSWLPHIPLATELGDYTGQIVGKQSVPVPANAMIPRTTNGAAPGNAETTTNKVMLSTLDFDASTIEYAQFTMAMPKSWDEGTISFQPLWEHGSTTTNFKVSWGLQAVAVSDLDGLDAAFGTAQFSNDTGGTASTLYVGPESSAITVGGTPAAGDLVVFQVLRKADDATNDTLAVDAKLIGIRLFLTTDAGTDA